MEPFRIHIADDVLADLRVRLRHTRWPDQVPGIEWKQGTELEWLRRRVSYWADQFDWRAWERRLNALNHFIWKGIHIVYQRAESGRGVPLILTHGWPGSFLDYVDMLPMLEDFDVVVPSLPGYGFSPRPPKVGINYRYVSERWHELMSELGYSRYGAGGYDFGAGVTTILALDHPQSVIGIHLTTLESDLTPRGPRLGVVRCRACVHRSEPGLGRDRARLQRDPVYQAADRWLWTQRLPGWAGRIRGREVALVERHHAT
jgi:pimeloyl-ACP methyl ester carboxylesterase